MSALRLPPSPEGEGISLFGVNATAMLWSVAQKSLPFFCFIEYLIILFTMVVHSHSEFE